MTRDDDPTQPLPEFGEPTGPTEPLVAPHVPIADVAAAEPPAGGGPDPAVEGYADPPGRRRGTGAILLAIGALVAVAAAAVAIVAGLGALRDPVPLDTPGSPSPSVSDPEPVAPTAEPGTPVDPADPAPPPDPDPVPTTPATEPPVDPTPPPEPTPTPTP